ncbi:MAG: LacI family DNA-binding transcriptional regulator, partial [Chthonomonas sp.]|nr:LacI family DNA-binding transcriptional regulator [Chthonomonas sp.]
MHHQPERPRVPRYLENIFDEFSPNVASGTISVLLYIQIVNTYSQITAKLQEHGSMRVTQQDIARLAKVSQSTVSRVVAGDQRVEEEIRERVMTVMRNHNYRPDVRARSLRTQSTHLIGLVMKREARDLQGDPFFSMFVSEILGFLSSTPYHLCVDIAASALRQEFIYDELLRTRRVDGLILVESEPRDERVERLQKDAFPFVIIGNPGSDVDLHSVDNDNILAGE